MKEKRSSEARKIRIPGEHRSGKLARELSLPFWLIAAAGLALGLPSCKRPSSGGSTITKTELGKLIASQDRVKDLEKRATAHFPGKGYSFSAIHSTPDSADPVKSLLAGPTMFMCRGAADVEEAIEVDRELRALFTSGELDGMQLYYLFSGPGSVSTMVRSDQLASELRLPRQETARHTIMHHFHSRDVPPRLLPVELRDDHAFMVINAGTLGKPQLEVLIGLEKERKIYRLREWEAVDRILAEIPEGSAISYYGKCTTPTFEGLPDDTWERMMGLIVKHGLIHDKKHDRIICDCPLDGVCPRK